VSVLKSDESLLEKPLCVIPNPSHDTLLSTCADRSWTQTLSPECLSSEKQARCIIYTFYSQCVCVLVFDSCLAQFPCLRFLVPTTKGTYPVSEVGARLDENILKSHRCLLSKSGACVMSCFKSCDASLNISVSLSRLYTLIVISGHEIELLQNFTKFAMRTNASVYQHEAS